MKVITYLAFTVLSILIQFCVMDYIHEKLQVGEPHAIKVTTHKEILNDLLKNISSKPHALYYRTHVTTRSLKNKSPSKIYNNSTLPGVTLGTTDVTTTIFDVLYDDNTSETESTSTTEMYFTSTEFDNITEITFFETKNKSTIVPSTTPKISFNKQCDCNLLFKVCDTNCCCDQDCSDNEHKVFQCGEDDKPRQNNDIDGCVTHILDEQRYGGTLLDSLFCVVKTNLPNRRSLKKYSDVPMGTYYGWKSTDQKKPLPYEFKKTLYQQADPVWLLKNGIVYYLDFPAPMINSYCTDRMPIAFLKEEKIVCHVKFRDLEMFNILKTSEEAMVISAINSTINSTDLNCSSLHCINWTILSCDDNLCAIYNKALHEASCTDTLCTNIAMKIDYYFYYHDAKIVNATIRLHVQNISTALQFMVQEINVRFFMANRSIDQVIKFSGNPGYLKNLPVIVSYVTKNHTDLFFNNTSAMSRMFLPENREGLCVLSNTSNNIVRFGINQRSKCRYVYSYSSKKNTRNMCNSIQKDIIELLRLNTSISISPFGNPHNIADNNWINLRVDLTKQEPVYGNYNENTTKLYCYNVINRVSLVFMYANVDEKSFTGQNKIISAKYEANTNNFSFIIEDISLVITIDVNFVDLSKPSSIEYAGSPHLNIHLPRDFFFPFPPNSCFRVTNLCIVTLCCYVILLLVANKITLE